MERLNLTGQRFGRLVALERVDTPPGTRARWVCRCDCGRIIETDQADLRRGKTRSCGCYKAEVDRAKLTKNGLFLDRRVPEAYRAWQCMKRRCFDEKSWFYSRYGGRGITVCPEWMDFETFHAWAISSGYAPDLQLDRIDNDGNYEPSNCRWVTRKENMRNTSRTRLVTVNGRTQCLTDWSAEVGVSVGALYHHLNSGEDRLVDYIASRLA